MTKEQAIEKFKHHVSYTSARLKPLFLKIHGFSGSGDKYHYDMMWKLFKAIRIPKGVVNKEEFEQEMSDIFKTIIGL